MAWGIQKILLEKVALFLNILDCDWKVRSVKFNYFRSGQTVSHHFNNVLKVVL